MTGLQLCKQIGISACFSAHGGSEGSQAGFDSDVNESLAVLFLYGCMLFCVSMITYIGEEFTVLPSTLLSSPGAACDRSSLESRASMENRRVF